MLRSFYALCHNNYIIDNYIYYGSYCRNVLVYTGLIVGFEQTAYTFSENAGNLTDEIRIVNINSVTSEINQTLIISSEDGSAKKGVLRKHLIPLLCTTNIKLILFFYRR